MRRPRYPYKPEDDGFFEEKYPDGSDESYAPDFDFYEGEPVKEWEAEADRANEIPVEMLMGNY
jgi:hypothetical protein